jgi:hypothetical protein
MAFVALADEVLHAIKSSKESTKLELCGEAGRVLGDTLAANTPLKELNLSADKGAEHESRLGAPFAWPPTSKSKFTFVGDHDSLLHWRTTSTGELLPLENYFHRLRQANRIDAIHNRSRLLRS